MSSHAELIHKLTGLWNSGDLEGASELYTADAEIRSGPHWPEQDIHRGREAILASAEEWASLWESLEVEVDTLEEYGDKVVVTGAWRMTGAASGVGGEMAIFIVFTVRDGRIALLEWFDDHDTAIAAAGDA